MLLNHLAAVLLFAGPLFYLGLWMAIDPGGIVALSGCFVRWSGNLVSRFAGPRIAACAAPEPAAIPRRLRTAVRAAGVALLLFAIAL